jgi:hypothetical protein
MAIEKVPDIPMFRQNTAGFVHELPAGDLSNVDGAADRGAAGKGRGVYLLGRCVTAAAAPAGTTVFPAGAASTACVAGGGSGGVEDLPSSVICRAKAAESAR